MSSRPTKKPRLSALGTPLGRAGLFGKTVLKEVVTRDNIAGILWHAEDQRCTSIATLRGSGDHGVCSVSWSPDGSRIASALREFVDVWDATASERLFKLHVGDWSVVSTVVSWSPDGSRAITGTTGRYGGDAYLWDTTAIPWFLTHIQSRAWRGVTSVSWSLDSTRVAATSCGDDVLVWSVPTFRCVCTLRGHTHEVTSISWSPNSARIASTARDETVRVWDAATGECLLTLRGHTSYTRSVTWSPDSVRLASGSDDCDVRVWDAGTGRCLSTLSGHTKTVNSVSWSPRGAYIASGGYDNTVRVWSASTGKCTVVHYGHSGAVKSVSWSPDGTRIASGSSDDGKVCVWGV